MRLIGLAGVAGSGKDTTFELIREIYPGAANFKFADPIKDGIMMMLGEAYGVAYEDMYGASDRRSQQIGDLVLEDGSPLTIRYALQTLGTEWGRECLHQDIWVNLAIQRAREAARGGVQTVVFTDCRFVSEARAIRDAGGTVWLIDRPGAGLAPRRVRRWWWPWRYRDVVHPSEAELQSDEFMDEVNMMVYNHGTIDDLRASVAQFLQQYGRCDQLRAENF